jgi:hypothetical protein
MDNSINSQEYSREQDSENDEMSNHDSQEDETKPKGKNKTLYRIQKNIQSYLNDPTPDKIKQVNLNATQTLRNH